MNKKPIICCLCALILLALVIGGLSIASGVVMRARVGAVFAEYNEYEY